MELRISVSKMGSVSVVKVDGALTREGLAELERAVFPSGEDVRLDFSELRSLDAAGLAAVRALREGGAEIAGASPYIALLIGRPPRPARDEKKRGAGSTADTHGKVLTPSHRVSRKSRRSSEEDGP
jgi:hypothetical protein